MAKTETLLVEIGCGELPPQDLKKLSEAFANNIKKQLTQQALSHGRIQAFATARRLALLVSDLSAVQAGQMQQRKGPALTAAYHADGTPTAACLGFAKSCSVSVDALVVEETEKGRWLFYKKQQVDRATIELLPELIQQALAKLPISKMMRWGDHTFSFVRPVQWLTLLYADQVVAAEYFGKRSDRYTYGHRFHHAKKIKLAHATEYTAKLAEVGKVIADFSERQASIVEQLQQLAGQDQLVIDSFLLDRVTAMVEWPKALLANFDRNFLKIPKEVLIAAIKDHQSCFHLLDQQGELLPKFIVISNLNCVDPSEIKQGNERVMRARLADAAFFYEKDCQQDLNHWCQQLKTVTFQQGLGSLYDKTLRNQVLVERLAESLSYDPTMVSQAALLAKTDLLSDLVGEFPELQGIMGGYYALHAGQPKAIAVVIGEHYLPRFADDVLPSSLDGKLLALADRFDLLVGIFASGQQPSGDKDPFALRRNAIAIVRLLIEGELNVSINFCLNASLDQLQTQLEIKDRSNCFSTIKTFILQRLRQWYKDQKIEDDVLQAVLACQTDLLLDFSKRLFALQDFLPLPAAKSLAEASKRIKKLLTKHSAHDLRFAIDLVTEPAEYQLATQLAQQQQAIAVLLIQQDYAGLLTQLAELAEPIDLFFEKVMIMVDDPKLRANRLALLVQTEKLLLTVADFSLLPSK